ncbi:MAG: hypothetical protein JXA71_14475, partial [Chitinispirillaceae bacterium]|nr:hypothetical protein [Chitinispirillaceae bacterium]
MTLLDVFRIFLGSKQDRDLRKLKPLLEKVTSHRDATAALSDEALAGKTAEFKKRLAGGAALEDLFPEAFAVFREATHRILGERRLVTDQHTGKEIPFMAHFDVQVIGAIALHQGKIAEMRTGEGKT